MPVYENPLVDEENPLYCPSVSAVAYLQSIRSQTHSESKRRKQPSGKPKSNSSSRILDDQLLQSFTSVLDRSLDEHDLAELLFAYNRTGGEPIESSGSSAGSLSTLSFWSQQKVACETRKTKGMDSSSVSRRSEVHVSSGFNDLQGSSRRGKSSVSINDHSFDLSAKADRLRYFAQNFGNSPYDGRLHQNGGNGYQYQISGTNSLKRKIRNLEGLFCLLI